MATDPHLSDAQIATIRKNHAEDSRADLQGWRLEIHQHRGALLDHSEAQQRDIGTLKGELHRLDCKEDLLRGQWQLADAREHALKQALTEASALATAQSERLAQAEAAIRVQIARNDALCEGYEAEVQQRNQQLTAQAERIAQLEQLAQEMCICAAVQFADGRIVRGHRHDACFHTAIGWTPKPNMTGHVQGFITSRNRFVDRHEGAAIQNAAGIRSAHTGQPVRDILFSEDLYMASHDVAALATSSPSVKQEPTP